MNRTIFAGMTLMVALLLACAGVGRSQEEAEPETALAPPDSPEVFVFNGGTAHLGVALGEVTSKKAQELKLPAVSGAMVTSVEKESAAAKAGLEKDDVIVEFDGVRVRSSAELRRLIHETPAGRTVAIKVIRDGQEHTLNAELEAPAHRHFSLTTPEIHIPPINVPDFYFSFSPSRPSLGISGDDLTPQLAQFFGVKQGKGVLVREVMVGSVAEKASLKAGDVIAQVDGKMVSSVDELRERLNENFSDDTRKVNLTIVRDHHEQTVTVELRRTSPSDRHRAESSVTPLFPEALAQLRAQADQMRAAAVQLRVEMQKQSELVRSEWQRQMGEQVRALEQQLQHLRDLGVARPVSRVI